MAQHGVAANLVMAIAILGGFLIMGHIRQEVFPEFQIDAVKISVVYQGASPEEVENGILLVIEDAISGVDGVDEVRSAATEGLGVVTVDALTGTDIQTLSLDIQKEVDRLDTLPEDAEEPQISILTMRRRGLTLALYGESDIKVLHEIAEQFRDMLLQDADITQIELAGIRPLEISIEVPQENLRRYNLTLAEIGQRINSASLDLPSGSIKTQNGEILIRMKERRDFGRQFGKLPIITTADGSEVLLNQIATIKDGYEDNDYYVRYKNKPAVMLNIFSVGKQTPIQISESVKKHLSEQASSLPNGIRAEILQDSSVDYAQRIDLLLRNSAVGLTLVFFSLTLFLELRLAFWVMVGIPIAFLGSFLFLPLLGVTLNMISLFAYIIALGIVVDDAIVIGENIYHYRQEGFKPMDAAIRGTREMATPITFSILTNIATFMPFFFMPGVMGKIFFMIPIVVITVFLISLAESLFVLPNHLGHLGNRRRHGLQAWLFNKQQNFSLAFRHWIHKRYGALLDLVLEHHYLTIIAAFALLISTLAYASSGRMGLAMFPKTESDFAKATLTLPYGSSIEKTEAAVQKLIDSAQKTINQIERSNELVRGIFIETGKSGSHNAVVQIYLSAPEIRKDIMNTEEFTQLWRSNTNEIIGVDSLLFESDAGGPGAGSAITIELNHRDLKVLEQASKQLAESLRAYPLVKDIDDGFSPGKQQLDFTVLPEGKSLNLSAENVARQVRNAFYGMEVLRQQRGRNEIKIMVRLPKAERISEDNIESLLLRTETGAEIPLQEAVHIKRGRAYTEINRRNGRRNVQVNADVTPRSKAVNILNHVKEYELPELLKQYPGLQYSFQGRQADMSESIGSLKISFIFALIGIYAMLAIPFQSYFMPLVVIVSIPFGIIGAIFGHLIMGFDLSILSMLGIVALSGIVVNDSLVLIDYANQLQITHPDKDIKNIIKMSGIQRFRPILLTTLTTFCGLAPMIIETSRQAKILIPMAISIGFGIVFATLITLVLIPALYLVLHKIRAQFFSRKKIKQNSVPHSS